MTDLSPVAQAVLDAYWATPWDPSSQHEDRHAIASVLRAAVEQCTYRDAWEDKFLSAERILAVAAELEAI